MRICPVCAEGANTKIVDLNYALFDDLQMSGAMQLVRCNHCHAFYNRTALLEEDFARYYRINAYYLDTRSAGSGGSTARDDGRYSRIYGQIQAVLKKAAPTVLDFGCGKGGMLTWLAANTGAKLIGVEASKECRSFVKETQALPVVESLTEVNKKSDVIILSHVLEHIYSPRQLIKSMMRIAKHDAVFYIEVPLAEAYIGKDLKWQELYFEHINHFTTYALQNLMSACGLQIVQEGKNQFYEDDPSSPACHYCIATPRSDGPAASLRLASEEELGCFQLPGERTITHTLNSHRPVSIWGISQYTQLVLGSFPQLVAQTRHLFDSSPAKTGRTIKGIEILSTNKLPTLDADDILLYPSSPYSTEMMSHLQNIGFPGQALLF